MCPSIQYSDQIYKMNIMIFQKTYLIMKFLEKMEKEHKKINNKANILLMMKIALMGQMIQVMTPIDQNMEELSQNVSNLKKILKLTEKTKYRQIKKQSICSSLTTTLKSHKPNYQKIISFQIFLNFSQTLQNTNNHQKDEKSLQNLKNDKIIYFLLN